jgi:molybdopterin molybdotransferase
MISLQEAINTVDQLTVHFNTCLLPLFNAVGNFYATDILSTRDFPPFNRSAVDGYALHTESTDITNNTFKVVATIYAGDACTIDALKTNECIKIMTGAAVPMFCNCVVRVEECETIDTHFVNIKNIGSTKEYQNIARKGEDCNKGNVVFKKGTRVKATHLSTLAAMGLTHIECYEPIYVPIINTGNEIIEPGLTLPNEQSIYESNSTAIKTLLQQYPITFTSSIVSDNWEALNEALKKCKEAPLLIFTGGVSAGDADFVPKVLEANGYKCLFHKIAMKPGKPLWLGINDNKQIAIGLPGNPISVMVNVKLIVERILRNALGANDNYYITDFNIQKEIKRPNQSLEVMQLYQFKNYVFNFYTSNGSGDILNTAVSDGFVIIPAGTSFLEKATLYPWFCDL